MYTWIWRTLPGGLPGKTIGSLLLLTGAVLLLFFVVFPEVEPLLPFSDVTVDGQPPPGEPTPPPGPPAEAEPTG